MDPKAILGILGPVAGALGGVAAGLGMLFLLNSGMGSTGDDTKGSIGPTQW